MRPLFELLGMLGIGLSVLAYLPQVTHLARERCSNGISVRSWEMWLASSLLIGSLATYRRDYVFMTLAATNFLSAITIRYLARRYEGMACSTHSHTGHRVTHLIEVTPPLPTDQ